ncbi:ABC transporter ATP-binding protein/permease [Salibacteraceae bacterium]|jgi:subfamily B ATP-binding cassette protein MsbA|nr:ABC transporter ATP-binding protein/permease [Salibacteraceae bacterium]
MKQLFQVLAYLKNYRLFVGLNILFNLLSSLFSLFSISLAIPFLNLIFLTDTAEYEAMAAENPEPLNYTVGSITENFNHFFGNLILTEGKGAALLALCVLIISAFLLKNLSRYMALFFIGHVRTGIVRDLRKDTYTKLLSLPLSFYSEERKGDIMARISSDVQEIEHTILRSLEMLFKDPITIVIFLTAMFAMNAKLTLFIFILLPVSGFVIGKIGKSLKRKSEKGQAQFGLLMSWVEESMAGLRIIKAFNAERFSNARFDSINENYRSLLLGMYRRRDLASPLSEFMGVGVVVMVMWYGGNLVLDGDLAAAKFIGFIIFFSQIISPSKSFTDAFYNIQKGAASATRIDDILQAEEKITDDVDAKDLASFESNLRFDKVDFSYKDDKVLNGVSFELQKGKMLALVGPSGGGKSTLADLVARFYDLDSGRIEIDGKSFKDIRIKSLRDKMGIVTQNSILFNDTIFNNISFGLEGVSMDEVVKAAKVAHAHDFILELPNGYHTNIGDAGDKLSGGQKQRISIARAILKNPPILILDEATSALDAESEKAVQEALESLMMNRTSIVIAHRLSTIQRADMILVLDKGEIVERGTHNELSHAGGLYQKLSEMQML